MMKISTTLAELVTKMWLSSVGIESKENEKNPEVENSQLPDSIFKKFFC